MSRRAALNNGCCPRIAAVANRLRPFQPVVQGWSVGSRAGRTERAPSEKSRVGAPCYGIIDSPSVKTQYRSEERGIDGGKRVKGRKQHIVVDILDHLRHVQVHAANLHDTGGLRGAAPGSGEASRLEAFSGDGGYRARRCASWRSNWVGCSTLLSGSWTGSWSCPSVGSWNGRSRGWAASAV